jgi:hypothetical protein
MRWHPKIDLKGSFFSCTFPAQRCKSLMINGAGEGNRTLVSGLGSPRSTIEPHPRRGSDIDNTAPLSGQAKPPWPQRFSFLTGPVIVQVDDPGSLRSLWQISIVMGNEENTL